MKIENLDKDLNTEEQKEVQGGIALTGQVVPTNVQSNAAAQKFDIASHDPVGISNSADQSNYSEQFSDVPVGSVFLGPDFLRRA